MSNVISFANFQKKSQKKESQFKKISVTQPKVYNNELTELYVSLGEVKKILMDKKKDIRSHPTISLFSLISQLRTIKDRAHSSSDATLVDKCKAVQKQLDHENW